MSKPLGEPKHFMSGAAFVSTTSRWTGDGRHLDQPGPGKPSSPVLATLIYYTYLISEQLVRVVTATNLISYFLFMHVLEYMGFSFFSALQADWTRQTIVYL